MTPAAVHYGQAQELHAARARVLDAAYERCPERFDPQATLTAGIGDRRLDQQPATKEVAHEERPRRVSRA